jgi:hypothetical protein
MSTYYSQRTSTEKWNVNHTVSWGKKFQLEKIKEKFRNIEGRIRI